MYDANNVACTTYTHAKYLENDSIRYEIQVNELTFRENQRAHFHDDIEVLFILEGTAELNVNGEMIKISHGDLMMLMPYHVHSITLKSGFLKLFQCTVSLGLLLYSSISSTANKLIEQSLAYGRVVAGFRGNEEARIINEFLELQEEYRNKTTLNSMVSLNILIKIILLFHRKVMSDIAISGMADHNLTWQMMQYLNRHFNQDISAKELAKEFGITPLKVNHLFYLLTGENFSKNLHQVRMRHACAMMQFEQLSNSYIGIYVGYKTSAAFFRKFKEMRRTTPEEYRKNHKDKELVYKSPDLSWKILLYVIEHYSEPLNEDIISKELFLTPQQIRAELQTSFDKTLVELIMEVRIQYACTFLITLEEPILKIAYMIGFSSVRTFNRAFKKVMEYTPIEFRSKYKMFEDESD